MSSPEILTVRDVQPGDGEQLQPLLEAWIRDSETGEVITDEVADALIAINACAYGDRTRIYMVAESAGKVLLGIMGLTTADSTFGVGSRAAENGKAAELINAFVNPNARGLGIGKLLLSHLEEIAKTMDYEEIVVMSGPRYRETGWPFWKSMYGKPAAILQDAYGPGIDAPIWSKPLLT